MPPPAGFRILHGSWVLWWTGLVSGSAAAEAAVELAVELVRTDSVNPGLVPGAAGEARSPGCSRGGLSAAGSPWRWCLPRG